MRFGERTPHDSRGLALHHIFAGRGALPHTDAAAQTDYRCECREPSSAATPMWRRPCARVARDAATSPQARGEDKAKIPTGISIALRPKSVEARPQSRAGAGAGG